MPISLTGVLICVVAGLVVGSGIAFNAPRLVRYRLDDSEPDPPSMVLLPVIGGWLAGYRPVRTLVVQLVCATIFLGLYRHYGAGTQLVIACGYAALLVTIAVIDLDSRLVLNRLTYPGILIALAGSAVWPGFGLQSAILGALTGLAIFGVLQILGRGALGTGDTKLAALLGAMRGFPGVFNALLFGVLFGGVAATILLLVVRRGRKEYMAYGPYLAAGGILALFT